MLCSAYCSVDSSAVVFESAVADCHEDVDLAKMKDKVYGALPALVGLARLHSAKLPKLFRV